MALRILYSGWFLGEGFRACGCEVAAFRPDAGRTLDEQVEATGFAPDLVFLELFGDTPLPQAIHESRHRLAAYCVDSPLNEFWLLPLMRLFDHVYVDQLASVARFRRGGVPAAWLPLCVNEDHFREPRERPAHFLTFVGRTSETRVKRRNLLEHIAGRHEVRLLRDVSAGRMLDAFADSQVVLNENFFSGLNLRFLHALASGSLLLTERGGRGVERFFTDGEHFVSYDHTDILDVLDRLKRDPEAFRAVAAAGQAPAVRLVPRMWFNPASDSRYFLVPGLMVLIMTLTGALLTAMVMAREWERGTMEALLVTPVRMGELLTGKLLPYFVLGMGGMVLTVIMALYLFGVPLRGSLAVLAGAASLFLTAALGMGLFISVLARNQFIAGQAAGHVL